MRSVLRSGNGKDGIAREFHVPFLEAGANYSARNAIIGSVLVALRAGR